MFAQVVRHGQRLRDVDVHGADVRHSGESLARNRRALPTAHGKSQEVGDVDEIDLSLIFFRLREFFTQRRFIARHKFKRHFAHINHLLNSKGYASRTASSIVSNAGMKRVKISVTKALARALS